MALMRFFRLLLLFVLPLACQAQHATFDLVPTGYVVDQADVLAPEQERSLASRLASLDDSTSIQFVVVTVSETQGTAVDTLARHYGNLWGVGQRGLNNGLLILFAPNARKVRIAVGNGLEWQISDSLAADVVNLMTPEFRAGRYYQGLDVGVVRLSALASAVSWNVQDHLAVGSVVELHGRYRDSVLGTDAGPVTLLLPPHWFGANSAFVEDQALTVFGRVLRVEPTEVAVLGLGE